MDLAELIKPEQVIARFNATDKAALLRELATRAALTLKLESRAIVDPILAREMLGSTGIGHGFALPHAFVPGLSGFFGMFARLQRPIDFAAVDGEPVDLVVLLLRPEGAGKLHLAALASISRRLREPGVADRLRRCPEPLSLYAQLTGREPGDIPAGP